MKRVMSLIISMIGKWKLLQYIILGILSGLFSFFIIRFITNVINLVISGKYTEVSKDHILSFILLIIIYIWIRRTLSLNIIKLSQTIFWKLRKQILKSVLSSDYEQLVQRKTEIQSVMINDVYALTDASINLITLSTSLILAVSCLIYLATISLILFVLTFLIATLGVVVYYYGSKKNDLNLQKSRSLENDFVESFIAILDGFKEIFIEPEKGESIYNEKILPASKDAMNNNLLAYTGFINNQITGQILFYLLISSILLYFSILLKLKPSDTVSYIFTLLYLLSSIETIMILLPGFMRAKIASSHLLDLEKNLNKIDYVNVMKLDKISIEKFSTILIKNLEFEYENDINSFKSGPINLSINKGDVIFIYGGNGSGKTTFIYSLLGLWNHSRGSIVLNNNLIENEKFYQYRSAFTTVLSDFYLFKEMYGVKNIKLDKWNYYLQLFEIETKVDIKDKAYTTTDLSAGQRKRLALIASLMEEKPILVLDEWAADQDPNFKRKFYTKIIPILVKEGLTIVAVTHDDNYYQYASKLYKMEDGKLNEEKILITEKF